jgi:type I restriction enzyme S subunit
VNAERLLKHYDRIADAPDAIPRLRRFILDLAVRGKLVPQDPQDEPASDLLKRIGFEKKRSTGRKRNTGGRSPHFGDRESSSPFRPPSGWTWSSIGELCEKTGSGSTPRGGKEVYRADGILFLRSQNVYDDGLKLQ